jgi:hypothetical protein
MNRITACSGRQCIPGVERTNRMNGCVSVFHSTWIRALAIGASLQRNWLIRKPKDYGDAQKMNV